MTHADGTLDLMAYRELFDRLKYAHEQRAYWSKQETELKEALAPLFGERTAGTLNGSEVITYNWTSKLSEKQLVQLVGKDLAAHYKTYKMVEVVDWDALRGSKPEIYEQCRVREFRFKD